jgi:hypothetical protein
LSTGRSGGQIYLENRQFVDSMIKPPMGGFFVAATFFRSPAGNDESAGMPSLAAKPDFNYAAVRQCDNMGQLLTSGPPCGGRRMIEHG